MKRKTSAEGRSGKLPDVDSWFSQQEPARNGGRVCWICARPEVRAWVDAVKAKNDSSPVRIPAVAVHRTLVETVQFPLRVNAVLRHWRECTNG